MKFWRFFRRYSVLAKSYRHLFVHIMLSFLSSFLCRSSHNKILLSTSRSRHHCVSNRKVEGTIFLLFASILQNVCFSNSRRRAEEWNQRMGQTDGRNEREKGTLWIEGSEFLHGNYRCDVFHARTRLTSEQYFERVIQKQRPCLQGRLRRTIASIRVESLIASHSQWFSSFLSLIYAKRGFFCRRGYTPGTFACNDHISINLPGIGVEGNCRAWSGIRFNDIQTWMVPLKVDTYKLCSLLRIAIYILPLRVWEWLYRVLHLHGFSRVFSKLLTLWMY